MTYHGNIKNGQIALDTQVQLREGAPVKVEVTTNGQSAQSGVDMETHSDFLRSKSIDEIAAAQEVRPVSDISTLYGNFWPAEENLDDFLSAVKEWHRGKT